MDLIYSIKVGRVFHEFEVDLALCGIYYDCIPQTLCVHGALVGSRIFLVVLVSVRCWTWTVIILVVILSKDVLHHREELGNCLPIQVKKKEDT